MDVRERNKRALIILIGAPLLYLIYGFLLFKGVVHPIIIGILVILTIFLGKGFLGFPTIWEQAWRDIKSSDKRIRPFTIIKLVMYILGPIIGIIAGIMLGLKYR